MAKFYISYVRYGDSHAIIVEAHSIEEAERYFLHQKSDAKICNIRLVEPEDEKHPGLPVWKAKMFEVWKDCELGETYCEKSFEDYWGARDWLEKNERWYPGCI